MREKAEVAIIGSDAGGTMTDMFVVDRKGNFAVGKASTTPRDESIGYWNSLADACSEWGIDWNREAKRLLPSTESCIYSGQGRIRQHIEANKQYLYKMLAESGVNVLTNTTLARITDEGAILVNKHHRYEAEPKADTVVLAVGLDSERALLQALEGKVAELYHVGDCREPGRIMDAVWDAFGTMRLV